MSADSNAYARAGVDIALGNQVKATLPQLLASATRPEVLGEVGGFGGLFALDAKKYDQPTLVSSVDGVGTKLKLAFQTGCHDTIGEDLVNHCVNDIAVCGAEPLFFLDYLGAGTLEPDVFEAVLAGFARGCAANHCALLGGETAQMPGFYQKGEYDVSGCIVGVVDRAHLLDGSGIQEGDVVIGLESNGLHTNGYSLARSILFDTMGLSVGDSVEGIDGTIGAELLRVHRSYLGFIQSAIADQRKASSGRPYRAFAHITGGGFWDNIPRTLPEAFAVEIQRGSWPIQPVFQVMQKNGNVAEQEMFHVFNMGIGLTAIVDAEVADATIALAAANNCPAWKIGTVVHRDGGEAVRLVG